MTGDPTLLDLAVFLVALFGTLVLTPVARRIALRSGFVDKPASHKFHRQPTPYLGGMAVALVVLASIALQLLTHPALHARILAFGFGAALVGGVGLIDDWRGLGIAPRVVAQAAAAVLLWSGGIRLHTTGFAPIDLSITVAVVVLVTNSINLMDNMDGMAAGTVAIASLCCYVMAKWGGELLIAPLALTVAGACIGFLRYNFPPARIFLGDAGSLLLGFSVAALLIEVGLPSDPLITRVLARGLVIAVPLFDTLLVVLSRRRGGRPVLKGGTDHLSHRLLRSGLTPKGTAVVIYLISVMCGLVGLALVRTASRPAAIFTLAAVVLGTPLLIRALEEMVGTGPKTSRIANTSPQARDTLRGAG